MKRLLAVTILAMSLAACTPSPQSVLTTELKGLRAGHRCVAPKRCYYIVLPRGTPRALLVAINPVYSGLFASDDSYAIARQGAAQGVITVYPDRDGGSATDKASRKRYGVFVNQVVQRVRAKYGIPSTQVSVVHRGRVWVGANSGSWISGRGGKTIKNPKQILRGIPKAVPAKSLPTEIEDAPLDLPDDAIDGNQRITTLPEE